MPTYAWVAAGVAGLVLYTLLYEYLRYRFRMAFARRWRGSVTRSLRDQGGALERFRFVHKQLVRLELLGDHEIHQMVLERARSEGRPVSSIQEDVEDYIDEIVPFFNLLSFYKIAHPIGKLAIGLSYDLVVDPDGMERIRKLPKDVSIVFVFNHRSNADFVIVNTIFAHEVALSFAVGEWARVWPLDVLFRSFGSYFVRRGFRDPLYHKTLERYVQFVTRGGLTQGFFIEGGLSRDGNLRPAKIGILSYILGTKRDPTFERDILFVPVGLGFDRVVEDGNLLAEARGVRQRKGILRRLFGLFVIVPAVVRIAVLNAFRVLGGRWRRFGHAAVHFGEPVSADEWLAGHPDIWSLGDEERKEALKDLAARILGAVGKAVPVTPVPLVALSLVEEGPVADELDLAVRVGAFRKRLEDSGAAIHLGEKFELTRQARQRLEDAREDRREELLDVEEGLVLAEENETIARIGLSILRQRKIVGRRKDGSFEIEPKREEFARYYANSIAHHLAPVGGV